MEINFLNSEDINNKIKDLLNKHSEIHIASAWGYNGEAAQCLLKNKRKFSSVTFGVAFCHTDPNLIDRLVGVKNAFIADSAKSTFHPKLYYFRTDNYAEAIIGSSNFTTGGLHKNWEANIHIAGNWEAPIFHEIRENLKSYEKLRKGITKELASKYRLQFNATKLLKKAKNPNLSEKGSSAKQLSSLLVNMKWKEYVKAIKASTNDDYRQRLSLLRKSQNMFASVSTFYKLSVNEWRAIYGVIGKQQMIEANLNDHEWGWFGAMKGFGDLNKRINEKDKFIAHAIDCIPQHGDVTEDQYDNYCKKLLLAFEGTSRKPRVATASRLLAMKRPDTFVCVSTPNKTGIAKALCYPKSTLNLDNYWERIVELIKISPWHNATRPTGKDAELWDGRAAMLDAIFYKL